jgi:hypothetical protein
MSEKEAKEFARKRLEMMREMLRQAPIFMCACCQKEKPKGEAAGAHLYRPKGKDLAKKMVDEKGQQKVATYVLCLECVDSLSDDIIHTKVTSYLGTQGLFG